MYIKWAEDAWADYNNWQIKDKIILKKINDLVKDILRS